MNKSKHNRPNKKEGGASSQMQRKAVYSIIHYEDKRNSYWLRLGTAYVNDDHSLTVYLDALPTNRELHIRDIPCHHK